MSTRFGCPMAAHWLLVFLPIVGSAQQQTAQEIRIELKSEGEVLTRDYTCELDESNSHQRFAVEVLRADSTFSFRSVPYGDYRLTIMDGHNNEVYQDVVTVPPHYGPMIVQLSKPKVERPPSGPVSLSQLQHPPSRKAFSAMVAAQRFSEAGDYPHAAEELQKAVRLSPDYADAHWNLAAQYIRMAQYSRAVEESHRALELAKPGPKQLCNLAFAQMQLAHYDEATESARASLRLDSTYAQAHFVLGTLLARDGKTLREALPHLELAARTLPSAAKVLELARKGLGNRIAQNAQ